MDPTATLISLI